MAFSDVPVSRNSSEQPADLSVFRQKHHGYLSAIACKFERFCLAPTIPSLPPYRQDAWLARWGQFAVSKGAASRRIVKIISVGGGQCGTKTERDHTQVDDCWTSAAIVCLLSLPPI